MNKLIEETLQIAKEKFVAFGFKEDQIEQLLDSGRRDLEKELNKLHDLIDTDNIEIEPINKTLHALKGLLYNMGNIKAGDIMVDIKNNTDKETLISHLKSFINA